VAQRLLPRADGQGMVLAASPEDGSGVPTLVSVPEGLAPGAKVR